MTYTLYVACVLVIYKNLIFYNKYNKMNHYYIFKYINCNI